MAQIRGTAGYNLGHQNPFGGPGRADATSDPSPLDAIREQTSKIEDWLDTIADPIKPYVVISLPSLCFCCFPKVRVPEFESRLSADTVSFFFVCRYLPAIGRFLIVVTFIEDSLRILTQWSDQLLYLRDYRQSMIPFLPLIAPSVSTVSRVQWADLGFLVDSSLGCHALVPHSKRHCHVDMFLPRRRPQAH